MVQMHYSSLFVILHAISVSTFSLTENELEEMDKLQQNNLATTMTTVNETTLAAEKMNITKLIKFVPSWIAFLADLDNSKDLATNIRNLEILCMNASVSTDTEEFNTKAISENIHPSMNASENNITIEEITTTLSEKTTLEQLESMSSSTLEQTKSTSSSTLEQKESTSSSTVNMNVQLSNRTGSKAISSVIYEKTDGVPTKCQSNADCYDLHEPEAWCDLKSDEFWFGQGCYCNEILKSCIIQAWKNGQLYYTDCRRRDQHHRSSNS
ncbi:unnamed protein product [Onchocerca ochengi]|uniref:Fibronectin type-II domain-containing protein n=1 Tax=Onchocerca ochengi TaxID=42157 RepID=A0A182EAA7_ONCOC|nr:unnamed protein product [Onchocerca ochengi]